MNSKLRVVTSGNQPAEIRIEIDPAKLFPVTERSKGNLTIKRTGWLEVYSSPTMQPGELIFPVGINANDESYENYETPISWSDYETMFLNKTSVYMINKKGGLGTLNVSFKYNDQTGFEFEENIEIATIRVCDIIPLDEALVKISSHDLLNSQHGLRYNISFYSGPTPQEFRSNLHMAVSVFGGINFTYPDALITPVDIFISGNSQNQANVVLRYIDGKNWLELKTFPIENFLPSAPSNLLEEPLYTYDIYPDERSQSPADCEMLGKLKPGMQYGKSRFGGSYDNYLNTDECISPVTDKNGHFSYIRYAGVVYPTFYVGNEIVKLLKPDQDMATFRNTCSWQASWFMQSGHGIGGRYAGLQVPGGRLNLLDTDEHGDYYKNVINQDWQKVKVAVLNSCYNLNLNVQSGDYPAHDEIWIDGNNDNIPNGRWNNGLKWFEILKKSGTVLGWGQCNVDGMRYGARSTGQSPTDKQYGIEWTAMMMKIFINDLKSLGRSPTSADLAEQWVKAAEKAIDEFGRNKYTPRQNMYNAIGIGVNGGQIEVWVLDKNRSPMARRVWQCTIN